MNTLEALRERYQPYSPESWFTLSFQGEHHSAWKNYSFQVRDVDKAAELIAKCPNDNVYSTMCVFAEKPKDRGTKSEFTASAYLWIDVDGTEELSVIREARPSQINFSGSTGHYHAYWRLDTLCTDVQSLESHLKGLQVQLNSDNACTDAVRCMRIPGTVNRKSGNWCKIVEKTDEIFTIDSFPAVADYIPMVEVDRVPFPDGLEESLKRTFKGTYVMERIMTEEGARLAGAEINLDTGKVIRHSNDYLIAKRMAASEYTPNEVGAVLTHPIWFSGDKFREKGWNYVALTVSSAFNNITADAMSKVNVYEKVKKYKDPKDRAKGFYLEDKFNPAVAATSIIERFHIKKHNGILYCYDTEAGRYHRNSPATIAITLKEALGNGFRVAHVKEVEGQIERTTPETPISQGYINVNNGILHVATRNLIPHTPDIFIVDRIPVTYSTEISEDAYAKWDKFASSITSPENMKVLEEQIGHCLTTETRIVRNPIALVLQGPRSSGKSELLQVINSFLGDENVSHVDLSDLAREQDYYTWDLLGKRANIRFETSTATDLINTDRVKSIISEEPTQVRRINSAPVDGVILHVRFFLATNDTVLTRKVDPALYKRMRILSCTHDWSRDPNRKAGAGQALVDDPDVMSAILNRGLAGYDRLRSQGEFSDTEATVAAMKHHREENDSVEGWLAVWTVADPESEETVDDMHAAYMRTFEAHNKRFSAGKTTFKKRLEAIVLDRPDFAMVQGYRWNASHNKELTWKGRKIIGPPPKTFDVHTNGKIISVPNVAMERN